MFFEFEQVQMIFRLILACILGGIIGLERESGQRPAGFRTHTLVCTGSCLFMLVSIYGFDDLGTVRDPARLAAQVVSGVGFLGAGTIMHEGINVKGLTTAASIWMVAAIGLASGVGMYFIAIFSTIMMLGTLIVLGKWGENVSFAKQSERYLIKISAKGDDDNMEKILSNLRIDGVKIRSVNVVRDLLNETITLNINLLVSKDSNDSFHKALMNVRKLDCVSIVENATILN